MHMVEAKGLLHQSGGGLGMNLYRGCVHGCIYCDSRSSCYGMAHRFEDVAAKQNAPALLEAALKARRKPCMIGTGSMSDPYMPCERELRLTRQCLELIHRYGFGAAVLTKSDGIMRDLELLQAIAERARAVVQMTLTTWDEDLCSVLEPNVCTTRRRLEVLTECRRRGIPTVVWLSPILPFLNDTEQNIASILGACAEAGVKGVICFDMGLTLRDGNREYFYAALDRFFPGLRARYEAAFGGAYACSSPNRARLWTVFNDLCARYGMLARPDDCFRFLNEFPEPGNQLRLPL